MNCGLTSEELTAIIAPLIVSNLLWGAIAAAMLYVIFTTKS